MVDRTIHILIADDEAPARGELHFILQALAPEAKFYQATNGEETLHLVESEPIQLVFLDINMPGIDGLIVAATIMEEPEPPLIVFATAYNEHTLRAFELAALDYVLKPFDERRLAKTMERVRHALDERSIIAEQQTVLRNYLRQAAPIGTLTKLWGERENQSRVLVDYHDILWVVAEMKDVFVQTSRGEKLRIRNTLKDLEPRLIPHNFARVHKGYLVNLDHIADVATWFSGSYVIHMTDAERTQIPMSRRYAAQLKKLTDWH